MQGFIDAMNEAGGVPDFAEVGVEAARENAVQAGSFIPPGPDVVRTQDLKIPGHDGFPLDARLYHPEGEPVGVVVFLHGGGFVLSSLEEYESICRHFTIASQCAILSISYRLAPEHPFPTPLEDCYAATLWSAENHGELLGVKLPLVVAGDSAGGNLSGAVSLLARDRRAPDIAAQLLIYPTADADFTRPSHAQYGSDGLLTAKTMEWFWDQYVADPKERANPLVSPVLAKDLSGLPPAMVEIAGHDPLRDGGEDYAEKMAAAGTQVIMRRWYGLCHGFFQLAPMIPPAMTAARQMGADLFVLLKDIKAAEGA